MKNYESNNQELSPSQQLLELGNLILEKQQLTTETSIRPDLGIAVVSGQWGMPLNNESHTREVIAHVENRTGQLLPPDKKEYVAGLVASAGADIGYWTKPLRSREEYTALQLALGKRVSSEALFHAGITSPDQIDQVMVATSAPATPTIARDIAESLGIKNRRPQDVQLVAAACASSSHAFLRALKRYQEDPSRKKILLIGMETMTALRDPFDAEWNGTTDVGGLSLFGDNISVSVLDLSHFELLFEQTREFVDTRKAISVRPILPDHYYPKNDRVLNEFPDEGLLVGTMPMTDNGGLIEVSTMGSVRVFPKFAEELIELGKQAYRHDFSQFQYWLMHRPSYLLFDRVTKLAQKIGGFLKEVPWKTKGQKTLRNSPATTWGFEFKRYLPDFQKGQKIIFEYYGAGVSGNIMGIQLK